MKRRKTFRVLNVIPASTFTSTPTQGQDDANQVQGSAQQQTTEVVQLYSHHHGTVISCNRELCQTLNWKRKWKWRVCGGVVSVRGYTWRSLRQEGDGVTGSPPCVDEKQILPDSLDDRGKAKEKAMKPGVWVPFCVKRAEGSGISCWELRGTTSGRVDAGGEEKENIAALMEEGKLEFVNEGLAEEEKRQILLTTVTITEWERRERRPGLAEKARQRVLRTLCLTA